MDASAKERERQELFFFSLTSAWQQKEVHDKNRAKIIVSGSKNLPQTLKTRENRSLHPISAVPPKGKLIHGFYIINKNDVFHL